MDTVKIVQHNVAHWKPYRHHLSNTYKEIDPDIILLNSHGVKQQDTLKVYGYITYKINSSNEPNDGSAILIKTNIRHKIKDDFLTDTLQITIETTLGPINLATTYLPPRRPYFPFPDFHVLASNHLPTYIIGDLNAKHQILGHKDNNTVGKGLKRMLETRELSHLGPDFTTYISGNKHSTPDIILSNKNAFHNHIIKPGPVTPSDHIPIIFTITASAIRIPAPARYNINKANWEAFEEKIRRNIGIAKPPDNATQPQIENSLSHWYDTIRKSMETCIPLSKHKTVDKPITNPTIKSIQMYLQNLMQTAETQGWTRNKFQTYKLLKQKLISESKNQHNSNWSNKTKTLIGNYTTPKDFWQTIKKLKGSTNDSSPYIIHNNSKVYGEKEREEVFRNIWKEVFTISPEDNIAFDVDYEATIN